MEEKIELSKKDKIVLAFTLFFFLVFGAVVAKKYTPSLKKISFSENQTHQNILSKKINQNPFSKDTDTDHDGLSDLEEIQYGTNPNLADSDNDGFTDKTEIQKGYNPLGSGKIKEGGIFKAIGIEQCYNSDKKTLNNTCVENLALKKHNINYCKRIYFDSGKAECYIKLIEKNNDIAICSELKDLHSIKQCKNAFKEKQELKQNLKKTEKEIFAEYKKKFFDDFFTNLIKTLIGIVVSSVYFSLIVNFAMNKLRIVGKGKEETFKAIFLANFLGAVLKALLFLIVIELEMIFLAIFSFIFFLFVNLILSFIFFKKFHQTNFKDTFKIFLVAFLIQLFIGIILFTVLSVFMGVAFFSLYNGFTIF